MKIDLDIDKTYPLDFRKLDQLAQANPLEFRRQAQEVYGRYSRQTRKFHAKLATDDISTLEFFIRWQDSLLPIRRSVAEASASAAFSKSLRKHLVLNESTAQALADKLSFERDHEEVERFLSALYTVEPSPQRQAAQDILTRSVADIEDEMRLHIDYLLMASVAKRRQLTIADPAAGRLKRLIQRGRQKREIKRYVKAQTRRLRGIELRQSEIETKYGGLILRIFNLQLDVVEVLAARQDYDKRLGKLTPTSQKSSTKRLEVFESVTRKIRDSYVAKVVDDEKLASLQQVSKEVDEVLIQVFDMSVEDRNRLMTLLKEYRDLSREKQQINSVLDNQTV